MSDRTNRDRGRKIARRRHTLLCDCWYCMKGADKKRIIIERVLRHTKVVNRPDQQD